MKLANPVELESILKDLDWKLYIEITNALIPINQINLQGQLSELPLNVAYYQGLLVNAKKLMDEKAKELEQYSSMTRQDEYEKMTLAGKRATDKYLESFVQSQLKYGILNKEATETQYKFNLLKALIQALEHKSQMLIQLSANQRAELQLNTNN